MKHETIKFKIRMLRWFSGLGLKSCQISSDTFSTLLKEITGVKDWGTYICLMKPCQRQVYSRGICQRHYSILKKLRAETKSKWEDFVKLGLCRYSSRDSRP